MGHAEGVTQPLDDWTKCFCDIGIVDKGAHAIFVACHLEKLKERPGSVVINCRPVFVRKPCGAAESMSIRTGTTESSAASVKQ